VKNGLLHDIEYFPILVFGEFLGKCMFGITPDSSRIQNILSTFQMRRKEAFHFWEIFGKFLGKIWERKLLIEIT